MEDEKGCSWKLEKIPPRKWESFSSEIWKSFPSWKWKSFSSGSWKSFLMGFMHKRSKDGRSKDRRSKDGRSTFRPFVIDSFNGSWESIPMEAGKRYLQEAGKALLQDDGKASQDSWKIFLHSFLGSFDSKWVNFKPFLEWWRKLNDYVYFIKKND